MMGSAAQRLQLAPCKLFVSTIMASDQPPLPLTPTRTHLLTDRRIDVKTASSLTPSVVSLSFLDVFHSFTVWMTISQLVRLTPGSVSTTSAPSCLYPGDSVGRGASRTLDLSTVLFLLDIEPDTFLSAPVPVLYSIPHFASLWPT